MKKRIKPDRAEVMRLAWAIRRKTPGLDFGAAEEAAWKVLRLHTALQYGSVRFSFRKENGEVREAVGTLRADLFVQPPKPVERTERLTLMRYYDVEKNAIRSFRADRIVQVAA